ncbi:hypothetical protein MMC08_007008 [Hypocenomyce scalaris]|nr:hypothetical protein [Hypocenomyce scalaris]
MSEPIPESVPTSQDPRSKRPTKRRALTPTSQQATHLNALFAKPSREIPLPPPSSTPSHSKPSSQLSAPPEIVANVQGSSAGAGSGEFHVYKASRRREYERLKGMDEEVRREREQEEWRGRTEEWKRKDEARTRKNKARREKIRAKKTGKGEEGADGVKGGVERVGGDGGGDSGGGMGVAPPMEGVATKEEEIGVIIYDED